MVDARAEIKQAGGMFPAEGRWFFCAVSNARDLTTLYFAKGAVSRENSLSLRQYSWKPQRKI